MTTDTLPARSRIDVSSIGRFEIDAEIGRGGMASVYAARDTETGQRVALKLLSGNIDENVRARFNREVKAASQLVHPGICRVIAFGVDEDKQRPFLAMEYVEGGTLFSLAKKAPLVPGIVAAEILRQLLEALACAHAAGVVHRDLKPQNVMLTPGGAVKLLDFGIAKSVDDETLTMTGMLVGTPAFMSPEQARAETLDGRSDLFSAAMTIASLVRKSASRFASPGTSSKLDPTQMLLRVAYEPHGPLFERVPHVPVALDVVLAKLTALSPENRVKSATEALSWLKDSGLLRDDGPQMLASFVKAPGEVGGKLAAAQAAQEIAFADAVERRPGGEAACALALHRAFSLLPGDEKLAIRLRVFASAQRITFDDPAPGDKVDDKIAALQKSFDENPAHAGVLRALSDRYKARGMVRQAAAYLWRYVVERPDDSHAALQLGVMLEGPSPPPGASLDGERTQLARLSTTSIVAGIKSGGLKRPTDRAGVPTRAMQRPSSPGGNAAEPVVRAANVVIASAPSSPDSPGFGSRAVIGSILVCAGALALYLVANTVALAKHTVTTDTHEEHAAVQTAVVVDLAKTVAQAEAALARDDASGAQTLASTVLIRHPSLEAGRTALWVRARASARLGDKLGALKDCEIYLEKATDFDDPRIAEVKALMGSLRGASTLPPKEELR